MRLSERSCDYADDESVEIKYITRTAFWHRGHCQDAREARDATKVETNRDWELGSGTFCQPAVKSQSSFFLCDKKPIVGHR